jgi:hypothetical protein
MILKVYASNMIAVAARKSSSYIMLSAFGSFEESRPQSASCLPKFSLCVLATQVTQVALIHAALFHLLECQPS